jgi:hypothetical protein
MTDIANAEAKKPGKKLLIWAGPGWPMLDSPRIQTTYQGQQQIFDVIVQLSTRLREARISTYSISSGNPVLGTYHYKDFLKGVPSALKASAPNLVLKVLAVQSGGDVFGPDNDLTAQINRCVQDAQAFYTLSFDPPHCRSSQRVSRFEGARRPAGADHPHQHRLLQPAVTPLLSGSCVDSTLAAA